MIHLYQSNVIYKPPLQVYTTTVCVVTGRIHMRVITQASRPDITISEGRYPHGYHRWR